MFLQTSVRRIINRTAALQGKRKMFVFILLAIFAIQMQTEKKLAFSLYSQRFVQSDDLRQMYDSEYNYNIKSMSMPGTIRNSLTTQMRSKVKPRICRFVTNVKSFAQFFKVNR